MNRLTTIKQQRNVFVFGMAVFLLLAIGITVYITKFQTQPKSKAAPSSVLSFSTPSISVTPDQTFNTDITIDPGSNLVSVVKLVISYDSSQLTPASPAAITINNTVFSQTLEGPTAGTCTGTQCSIIVTVGTGSDPTKAITAKSTVATLHMKAVAGNGSTSITFGDQTAVYSIGSSDS